ncbi:hypothetical protein PUN28_015822 [Cardiocondyla obscurior]|uniref:Uncharacterized protein n=1 Tax=Cardiocondyla obscurior TaxID=286306 RepID=A0AAW2ERT0_9HYME
MRKRRAVRHVLRDLDVVLAPIKRGRLIVDVLNRHGRLGRRYRQVVVAGYAVDQLAGLHDQGEHARRVLKRFSVQRLRRPQLACVVVQQEIIKRIYGKDSFETRDVGPSSKSSFYVASLCHRLWLSRSLRGSRSDRPRARRL